MHALEHHAAAHPASAGAREHLEPGEAFRPHGRGGLDLDAGDAAVRRRGLNDAQWCRTAGVRKETLSRLRKRANCDPGTLASLAAAIGARLGVAPGPAVAATEDGHFPAQVGRDYEERLLDLVASGTFDLRVWQAVAPAFFMAGLAVMAASLRGFDRRRLLSVAEALHSGSSQPEVFALWLQHSAVRPSRFVPLLRQRKRHAA